MTRFTDSLTKKPPRREKPPITDKEHLDRSLFGWGARKRLDQQQVFQTAEEQKSGWSL